MIWVPTPALTFSELGDRREQMISTEMLKEFSDFVQAGGDLKRAFVELATRFQPASS